ncbi:MFS transporter, partial [bacterium]|nr:MFS transporter [bacterium]
MKPRSTGYILGILACIQFTHILDFVIMMPLGPQLMRAFSIGPAEFGMIVSAYTFSAGLFGFLGAFVMDRIDRKVALLVTYTGFIAGTLWCGVAPSHYALIAARVLAGAFGGVMGALIFSIIGDVFPESQRGKATGIVMSAFSVASVIGIPAGLFLASRFGWHVPFFMIGGFGIAVLTVAMFILPSMREHLSTDSQPAGPVEIISRTLTTPNEMWAILLNLLLVFSAFSVIPYVASFMVANVGVHESQLPWIYLAGGGLTFFSSQFIGRLSDRIGKRRTFIGVTALSMLPLLIVPSLPHLPFYIVLVPSTLFFILVSGRFVPAMAMITSAVPARHRGSFLSLVTAVQQAGSGLAAYSSGLIIKTGSDGRFLH